MKLIVAGSRSVTNYDAVESAINELVAGGMVITAIIEGTSRGVDTLASRYAYEHGIENIRVPAEWSIYNKGAGKVRNKKMAEMGEALLAIWDGNSSGTKNMIAVASKSGLPVFVHRLTKQEEDFK